MQTIVKYCQDGLTRWTESVDNPNGSRKLDSKLCADKFLSSNANNEKPYKPNLITNIFVLSVHFLKVFF